MAADDAAKAAATPVDLRNVPWGSVRDAAKQFVDAWDEFIGDPSEDRSLRSQQQSAVHLSLVFLLMTCKRSGLLQNRRTEQAQIVVGRGYLETSLAVRLTEAVRALIAQVRCRPAKSIDGSQSSGGYTVDVDHPFPFDEKHINAVRNAANKLPATPVAQKPLVRVMTVMGSIPSGQAIKLQLKTAKKPKRGRKPSTDVGERQALIRDWQEFKVGKHGTKKEFCASRKGITRAKLNAALNAERAARNRAKE
jgi:hypothetical protein